MERTPRTIREFCAANRFSRSHYYKLKHAGRGPRESRALGVITISPEAEDDWRREITENPIPHGISLPKADAGGAISSAA